MQVYKSMKVSTVLPQSRHFFLGGLPCLSLPSAPQLYAVRAAEPCIATGHSMPQIARLRFRPTSAKTTESEAAFAPCGVAVMHPVPVDEGWRMQASRGVGQFKPVPKVIIDWYFADRRNHHSSPLGKETTTTDRKTTTLADDGGETSPAEIREKTAVRQRR